MVGACGGGGVALFNCINKDISSVAYIGQVKHSMVGSCPEWFNFNTTIRPRSKPYATDISLILLITNSLFTNSNRDSGTPVASFFSGVRIRLGTILGRFSIIYYRGLGLRIRVWVGGHSSVT